MGTNPIVDMLTIYFQRASGTILIEVNLPPIGSCGFPFKLSQFGLLAFFINQSGKSPVGPITCKGVASIRYCQVEIIRTFNLCFDLDCMPHGFPSDQFAGKKHTRLFDGFAMNLSKKNKRNQPEEEFFLNP